MATHVKRICLTGKTCSVGKVQKSICYGQRNLHKLSVVLNSGITFQESSRFGCKTLQANPADVPRKGTGAPYVMAHWLRDTMAQTPQRSVPHTVTDLSDRMALLADADDGQAVTGDLFL